MFSSGHNFYPSKMDGPELCNGNLQLINQPQMRDGPGASTALHPALYSGQGFPVKAAEHTSPPALAPGKHLRRSVRAAITS